MLILHLSDIHFRYPACASPDTDPEKPYRTRLLQDARARVAALGPLDAILVGGDVAYSGRPEEYEAARNWLHELAEACKCSRARIYVIPGNHDVDWNTIKANIPVQNAQRAIIHAADKEKELRRQFEHSVAGASLLAPLTAYNDFAAPFSCQVFTPDKLYWHQDIPLDQSGVVLRIFGLTSTILSGAGAPEGKEDVPNGLYLSPMQTVLNPVDNVINLVMCHHPPDWFSDGDKVADTIKARASIHAFGHKHRQRIDRDPSYVSFSAGAVNPDRNEKEWSPGYNIFRLTLGNTEKGHHLDVEAHLLAYQANPEMFLPMRDSDGSDVFEHRVRLRNISLPAKPTITPVPTGVSPQPVDAEAAMGEERARNIVLRFWDLTMSDRREISQKLNLLEPDEMGLPQSERYGRALLRAGQRNLLDDLANEIEKREKRK
ncbi:metallophosphoesterase [Tardiphaga sp. 285_C5_N1_2]|uniref:metallophosphoesterase n=1 Tax=Tardiphaga sp. 285_C5_N1_2 TaxID=3240775 RepID=UPI003F8AB9BE